MREVVKDLRVFVNDHPVEVYPGACVRHALLRYSETVYQDAVAGKLTVTDRHGNKLSLGGPLEEGFRLTVEGPGGYRPAPANPELLVLGTEPASRNGRTNSPAASVAAGVAREAGDGGRRRRRGRRRGHRRRGRGRGRSEQGGV